ncbi:hypothetical protein [Actinomadura formosensis]|uniref:hypothetical protein n=1 Tax=Actinomadura formosensis TaxID=60706 RepID=UPI000833C86A|nr:hypothetical protein [Actinomadura formosensis]
MDGCGTPSFPPAARRHLGQAIRRHHIELCSGSRAGLVAEGGPSLPAINKIKTPGAAPTPAGRSSR